MRASGLRGRHLIAAWILILVSALSGCAHTNPRDPFEPLNRGIYAFNDTVDTVVLKPIATGYKAVLPQFVRTGVRNFFSNLDDITVIVNGLLQLKGPQAVSDTGRFLINTTVGVLGLFDVATHFGLEKHNEDFGQTLGYWGVGNGPFLMLPFLGPSTVRDGIGRWVDRFVDPVMWEDHIRTRNQFLATRVISQRAQLLESEKLFDTAAIDRYAFLRDSYLQRRRNLVFDGNPPPDPEEDEFNGKPRSELTPALPVSVLVDQYGNPITSAYDPPAAAQPPAAQAAPAAPAAAVAADPAPGTTTPANVRSQTEPVSANGSSPRVMRVWLSGGSPAQ